MLKPELGNARERRLIKRFRALSAANRDTLEAFAEFLTQREAGIAAAPEAAPLPPSSREPRPEEESVIAAIKRLRRSYPQLDASELLDQASLLMSAHMLQGRPAAQVIDELEQLFARQAAASDPAARPEHETS
ncbi:hypothetical protein [Rhabdochromatium marinum]|uniref:hypothetical protein n=1 Tax=Rhabdochromatium marinum TaxID=48729 RepID=UPI0019086A28|nr:hypothetical protein [Rhabdochromatium marinum]MBK1649370.1 hypothetical protein [Rhabdochromatium marinum]